MKSPRTPSGEHRAPRTGGSAGATACRIMNPRKQRQDASTAGVTHRVVATARVRSRSSSSDRPTERNSPAGPGRRILRKSVSGIKSPSDFSAALVACAAQLGVGGSTGRRHRAHRRYGLDSCCAAAVIAHPARRAATAAPEVRQLLLQRSRATWAGAHRSRVGYDLLRGELPLEQWVKVCRAATSRCQTHYYYEGQAEVVRCASTAVAGARSWTSRGRTVSRDGVGAFVDISRSGSLRDRWCRSGHAVPVGAVVPNAPGAHKAKATAVLIRSSTLRQALHLLVKTCMRAHAGKAHARVADPASVGGFCACAAVRNAAVIQT